MSSFNLSIHDDDVACNLRHSYLLMDTYATLGNAFRCIDSDKYCSKIALLMHLILQRISGNFKKTRLLLKYKRSVTLDKTNDKPL